MSDSETPHDKAVAQVIALSKAVLSTRHAQARSLGRAAGFSSSAGYRALATMEARGMLIRDGDGVYQPGAQMLRVGLAGWGLGGLAAVLPPVLDQLRRGCARTAAVLLQDETRLAFGPVAMGRGPDYRRPPDGNMSDLADPRQIEDCTLREIGCPGDRTCRALCLELAADRQVRAWLAILLVEADPFATRLFHDALQIGRQRLQGSLPG